MWQWRSWRRRCFAAYRLGRGPGVFAAFLSVAVFDFFFVPPRFTFAVSDVQYLLTFAVMLVVALLIGQLTVRAEISGGRGGKPGTAYPGAV